MFFWLDPIAYSSYGWIHNKVAHFDESKLALTGNPLVLAAGDVTLSDALVLLAYEQAFVFPDPFPVACVNSVAGPCVPQTVLSFPEAWSVELCVVGPPVSRVFYRTGTPILYFEKGAHAY